MTKGIMETRKVVKAEQAANMMERLPQEVIIGILSRLPITSLIQSKLVCPAWRSLIQDPLLASENFSRLADNDPSFILQTQWPASYQLYLTDFSFDREGNLISQKLPNLFTLLSLVVSCNGLLCLHDSLAIYICNPFTRVSIKLPKFVNFSTNLGHLDFGFHPTTKEYKLVQTINRRQFRQRRNPTNVNESTLVEYCEVNVLIIGSPSWRNLGTIPYRLLQASTVLVNGKLHWLSRPKRYFGASLIISFDLESEQFQEVVKPDRGGIDKCFDHLTVLRGCLSVAAYQYGQLEVLIMKEYGVKESWVREFKINIGSYIPQTMKQLNFQRRVAVPKSCVRVICILKSGEMVLEYQNKSLVLYDPQRETIKEVTFPEMPACFTIRVHFGSLHWLN